MLLKLSTINGIRSNDPSNPLSDLIEAFGSIDNCYDVCEAKAFCRKKIMLMEPGDEILVM